MENTAISYDSLSIQINSLRLSTLRAPRSDRGGPERLDRRRGVEDRLSLGMDALYKGLGILSDKIMSKLDEVLKNAPSDAASETEKGGEHGPEKTSDRIVAGVTALLPLYAKQHPEMSDEELISSFMKAVRGGVKEGYEDAVGTLKDMGLFEVGSVQKGIEKTMKLVDEKLSAFENAFRKEHGLKLDSPEKGTKSKEVSSSEGVTAEDSETDSSKTTQESTSVYA